jgi:HlyD family secretion protein
LKIKLLQLWHSDWTDQDNIRTPRNTDFEQQEIQITMDRKIEKKFWTTQRILMGVLGAAFIGFFGWQLLKERKTTLNVDQEKLTISEVAKGTFDEFIPVTGGVQPLKTIRLDAIVGGYVTEKIVEGGNNVTKGQTLLRLENQNLKLSFLQSETEANRLVNELQSTRQRLKVERFTQRRTLAELDAQIEQAKDLYDRNKQLVTDKVVTEQEYLRSKRDWERLTKQREIEVESQKYQEENAVLQIKQLEGTLDRTQRNVELWRQTLENLVVKAPVGGLLSSMDVEVGSNISQGQNIGQIDDLNGFKIRADIDEYYVSRVFVGLPGSFEFNGQMHTLEISKIYPEVRNGRFQVDMIFVKGAPEGIKRGQSVTVRLELGQPTQAVLLPTGGFFSTTGGNWVYVLEGSSGKRAVKRRISLGRKNPEFYEVLEGLKPGEKVITSSYDTFGDNEVLEF